MIPVYLFFFFTAVGCRVLLTQDQSDGHEQKCQRPRELPPPPLCRFDTFFSRGPSEKGGKKKKFTPSFQIPLTSAQRYGTLQVSKKCGEKKHGKTLLLELKHEQVYHFGEGKVEYDPLPYFTLLSKLFFAKISARRSCSTITAAGLGWTDGGSVEKRGLSSLTICISYHTRTKGRLPI
ncbi:hypothetical protein L873DRAFT_148312 [Choiromyces venosus 120613-1]|uniref:Secreted protein n=1 Tax=Choiromyces venosus 120613-1 TaxID=1336337 RepID=A0A3N4J7S3_9PEZI|nr:hypothetical protein L873DRAFT_148312 [Choiromyces venosus 120613-1]